MELFHVTFFQRTDPTHLSCSFSAPILDKRPPHVSVAAPDQRPDETRARKWVQEKQKGKRASQKKGECRILAVKFVKYRNPPLDRC